MMNIKGFFSFRAFLLTLLFLSSSNICASIDIQKKRIYNIVFDLFGVLLRIDKKQADQEMRTPQSNTQFDSEAVMSSPRWGELDSENATPEDIASTLSQTQDTDSVVNYIKNIGKYVKPIHIGMEIYEQIVAYKPKYRRKYNTYILSNVSKYCLAQIHEQDFFDRVSAEQGFKCPNIFKNATGEVYSFFTETLKPDVRIYDFFLDFCRPAGVKTQTFAEKTLFIDDSKRNLEGARKTGILAVSCQCHSILYFSLLALDIIDRNKKIEQHLTWEEPKEFARFKLFSLNELQDFDLIAHDLADLRSLAVLRS